MNHVVDAAHDDVGIARGLLLTAASRSSWERGFVHSACLASRPSRSVPLIALPTPRAV